MADMHDFGPRASRESGGIGKNDSAENGLRNRRASHAEARRSSLYSDHVNKKDDEKGFKSTFVDANAMKEKVRQNLSKPQHSVRDYYHTTGAWQAIAKSTAFEYASLAVVGINSLWIAVDTDLNGADLLLEAHPVFQFAENAFCALFFLEWLCRFMSFKQKRNCMRDAWFMFDSFMVFMMVMETWVMTTVLLMIGGSGGGAGNASILRIARLLRLSRMARMARLLRALPELMIMIRGMVAATRSVFFTLCLLVIVIYIFAIAFTQLCADTQIGNQYFSTVPDSMFTLLIYGTLLDNIGQLAKELGKDALYIAVIFFVFVLIAALTVMNMLIGVLCEVVNAVAATEKEEMLVTYVNTKLQRVVSLLDADGGGTISKKEFMQILENMDAVRCLQDVGVDVIGLVDFADFIFEKDDGGMGLDGEEEAEDDEDGIELDFAKFMDVVLQLRGTNNATVKDIVDLRKFMRTTVMDLHKQMNRIASQMEKTRQTIVESKYRTESFERSAPSADSIQLTKPNGPKVSLKSQEEEDNNQLSESKELYPVNSNDSTEEPSPATLESYQLEGGGLPSPVQPSVPVHLLRLEDDEVVQDNSDQEHAITKEYPDLVGQWYPVESATTQLQARNELPQHRDTPTDPRVAGNQSSLEPKGDAIKRLVRQEAHDRHKASEADPFLADDNASQNHSSL